MNVRLAVELTGTRIDVISIDEARKLGIEFTWNGNVTKEDVEKIESGVRFVSSKRENKSQHQTNNIQIDSIDSDIQSFNEEMDSFNVPIDNSELDAFKIDNEEIFSADELEELEDDFNIEDAEIDSDFL